MVNRLFPGILAGALLGLLGCGHSGNFDWEKAKGTLESAPVSLDGEQVKLTAAQLDCGVQSELWEAPSEVSQGRTVARLNTKGRELNFSDDPVSEPSYRQPHVQIRGSFPVQVEEITSIRDGPEKGTKLVVAKAGIRIQHSCFSTPLPLMGVKRGNFSEDTPPSFLFGQDGDWRVEKIVH